MKIDDVINWTCMTLFCEPHISRLCASWQKSSEFDFPSNGYNHAIWNKKLHSKNADFSNHMGEARVSLKILNQSILKYFIKFHASITKLSIGTKLEQRTPHYY